MDWMNLVLKLNNLAHIRKNVFGVNPIKDT
jgi:hypothetical protein